MPPFSIQVVRSVYTSKIISSYRDLVALVFYGTEQSKNPRNSFKNVYVYHNLDEPGKMLRFSNSCVWTSSIVLTSGWNTAVGTVHANLMPQYHSDKSLSALICVWSPPVFHRCKAGAWRGRSPRGKGCQARGRDHGQRGDVIRHGPLVLRQPLQWHQAPPLTQAAHDFHLQGWATRGGQCEGPTGSHPGQWPERDRYVWSSVSNRV